MYNLENFKNLISNESTEIQEKLIDWFESNQSYYFDEPIMSDELYDELLIDLNNNINNDEIKSLLNKSLFFVNEYDNIIYVKLIDDEIKTTQMVSLKKIKWTGLSTISEIQKFINPTRKPLSLFYGMKLDGMAVKITKNNNQTLIITRGGQNITDMLINHPDIVTINRQITHGELVIKKSVFNEKYSDQYENPRNCILGVLKQNPLDLDFIECTDGISPLAHIHTIPQIWYNFSNQDLSKIYYELKQNNQYQIDGLVIGYETDTQLIKDNYVLNMVAIKFKAPSVKTKIINIDWTQKKSGNLTPVIEVEPVKLDGSTISYVSGYNYGNLRKNHIGIGSEILISKSGDIIPVVEKVLSKSNNFNLPEDGSYYISGKHLIATNNEESITYKFILALKLLNIDGIGPTIAEKIGKVVDYNIIELFNTDNKPKIINVIGNGAIWSKFQNFYQIKNIGLDLLIELLQFDRCGKTLSKKLAQIILKESTDVRGIDKNVLNNVCRGEGFKLIKNSMEILKSYNIVVTKPIKIDDSTISFEMSGNPPKITKNDFIKKLKERFPNSTHVTLIKDTKYLFVDDLNSSSSKINKARKYNIKIVTYSDALNGKL